MHLQSNAHQRTGEYRRYFPDWTHRSLRVGEELEADHNSYLAGGYAEEFGYLAQAEASAACRWSMESRRTTTLCGSFSGPGYIRGIHSDLIRSPWMGKKPRAVSRFRRHRAVCRTTGITANS